MKTSFYAILLALGLMTALPAGAQTLIHRYSFNGNANDSVGTANGTVVGGVTFASEPTVNGSAVFPGGMSGANPAYISLPVSAVSSLQNATVEIFTTNFTMPNDTGGAVGGPFQALFSVGTAYGDTTNYSILSANRGSGGLGTGARINSAAETVLAAHDTLPIGQGNHIIDLVFSGFSGVGTTGTETICVDGTQVAQGATTLSFADIAASASGIKSVGIGGGSPWNDPTYIGAMNEVRIFDNALNADQMAAEIADGPATVGMVSLTALSPATASVGAPVTVTLTGTGFTSASTVKVGNDTGLTPTYVSPTSLTVAIPASDLAAAGPLTITAATPSTGGGQTASLTLNVVPAISAVTLAPAAVTGGTSLNGTVTLNVNAAADTIVALKSSVPAALTVPATITVPAGSKSATFTATTLPVSAAATPIVTATLGSLSKTATATVNPAVLSAVTFNPVSATGGLTTTGTLTFTGPLAASATVSLTSSSPSAMPVPATVAGAAGASSINFTIKIRPVTVSTKVTITATYNGVSKTRLFQVYPAALYLVSVRHTVLIGGANALGTLTMTGPVAANAMVTLTSSNPAVVPVPASATVTTGAVTVSFPAATQPVAATTKVTITASYAGVTKTAVITVLPALTSVSFTPSTVLGGKGTTGTVILTTNAVTTIVVSLTSSNPAVLSVPATVSVVAARESQMFTAASHPVSAPTTVTVTASVSGISKTTTVTVNPPALSAMGFTAPSVPGGLSALGNVTLTGLTSVATPVTLTSSNPAVLSVPSSVLVGAGSRTANFSAVSHAVSAATPVTVTATLGGVSKTTTLTVLPAALSSVTVVPASVKGGASASGNVWLTGPAATAATVTLTSSVPSALSVPSSVVVPAGAKYKTFTAATHAVTASTPVTVTATCNGVSKTVMVTVTP